MAVVGNLITIVSARTKPFNKSMGLATQVVRGFSRAIGTLALGGGAIAGLVALGRSMEDFNKKMNRSIAIMGNVSDVMRDRMERAAIDVAKTTVFSASEVAEAFFFLASAGLNTAQSIAALPLVAEFAQAGMFNLSEATSLLTDAQSALGLKVEDIAQNMRNLARVGDVLVGANTLADATTREFAESLTVVGGRMRVLGVELETGVALLAAFAERGVKGREAGTALDIVLRELANKAFLNEKAWRDMGIEVFDSNEKFRNAIDILADMEDAFARLTDKQKIASLAALGLTQKSNKFILSLLGASDQARDFEDRLLAMAGKMREVAAKQMTALEDATNRLGGEFTELSLSLQTGAVPAFVDLVGSLVALVNKFALIVGIIETFRLAWIAAGASILVVQFSILASAERMFRGLQKAAEFVGLDTIAGDLQLAAGAMGALATGAGVALEQQLKAINEQWNVLGSLQQETADSAEAAGGAMNSIGNAMDSAANSAGNMTDDLKEVADAVEKLTAKLQDQVDMFGLSSTEAALFRLGIDNLTESQLAQVRAVQDQLDELELFEELQRKAERVIEEMLTPLEKYSKRIEELEELLARGLLTQEIFQRAVGKARDALEAAQDRLAPKAIADRRTSDFQQVRLSKLALQGVFQTKGEKMATVEGQESIERILKRIEENQHKPTPMQWSD